MTTSENVQLPCTWHSIRRRIHIYAVASIAEFHGRSVIRKRRIAAAHVIHIANLARSNCTRPGYETSASLTTKIRNQWFGKYRRRLIFNFHILTFFLTVITNLTQQTKHEEVKWNWIRYQMRLHRTKKDGALTAAWHCFQELIMIQGIYRPMPL